MNSIGILDIGNTRIKAATVQEGVPGKSLHFMEIGKLREWMTRCNVEQWVVGQTGDGNKILETLPGDFDLLEASAHWDLPIEMKYETPDTLGIDRLAGVCGAYTKYKGECIIFDIGTCMTVDRLSAAGEYLGGNIAPGWQMRLKAMHEGTVRLPMGSKEARSPAWGINTGEALQMGAYAGLLFEIRGYLEWAGHATEHLNVILTGGDAFEFALHLKKEIFVEPDLILYGLYQMYLSHFR